MKTTNEKIFDSETKISKSKTNIYETELHIKSLENDLMKLRLKLANEKTMLELENEKLIKLQKERKLELL